MQAIPADFPYGNLPAELNSHVGGVDEQAEAVTALGRSRLVTFSGIGGVGKTRCAVRVATELQPGFDGGAWLVDLSQLDDASQPADRVAEALGLDASSTTASRVLVDLLRTTKTLLLLDSCESAVEAVTDLVGLLLKACPNLVLIVTSRQPLGIAEETVVTIRPLPVPWNDNLPVAAVVGYESVQLFVDRARAALGAFDLSPANQEAVVGICRQLDGIPLAIELAAVRLRALSPGQLLRRLEHDFRLLSRGREVHDRHHAVWSSIAWSYDLCAPAEQALWRRLSLFPGGIELDVMEPDGAPEADEITDLVTSLVEKSILLRDDHGPAVRYRLLEVSRQFGHKKLVELGELDQVVRRNQQLYDRRVARVEAEWMIGGQLRWLEYLRRDHTNLVAVLDSCLVAQAGAEIGLRIAAALRQYWWISGNVDRGRHLLGALGEAAGQVDCDGYSQLQGLHAEAWLALVRADTAACLSLTTRMRQILHRLPAEHPQRDSAVAMMTAVEGIRAMSLEDFRAAAVLLTEAAAVFSDTGDTARRAEVLLALGLCAIAVDNRQLAMLCHSQTRAITEPHDETWFLAYARWWAGVSSWRAGEFAEATLLVQEAFRLADATGWSGIRALSIEALAWIAGSHGDAERALVLLTVAANPAMTADMPLGHWWQRIHDDCELAARRALGKYASVAAVSDGAAFTEDEVRWYAMDYEPGAARRPRVNPSDLFQTLTARQRQVAGLVAEGASNKEIASALSISLRTAEAHVDHVLTKLGLKSRTQLAAWMAAYRKQR